MPWKLSVLVLALFGLAAFIAFNLGNACDVSFGFAVLRAVPVFLTVLFSFAAGMSVVLPFVFRNAKKARGSSRPSRAKGAVRAKEETGIRDGPNGIE
jgi:hypothetical protein